MTLVSERINRGPVARLGSGVAVAARAVDEPDRNYRQQRECGWPCLEDPGERQVPRISRRFAFTRYLKCVGLGGRN